MNVKVNKGHLLDLVFYKSSDNIHLSTMLHHELTMDQSFELFTLTNGGGYRRRKNDCPETLKWLITTHLHADIILVVIVWR